MTPCEALGNPRRSLSWGVLGMARESRTQCSTSASVTTLFLNSRSSSSSEEHLGLRSRKALESRTHLASHTRPSLGRAWGPSWGGWGLAEEDRRDRDPKEVD